MTAGMKTLSLFVAFLILPAMAIAEDAVITRLHDQTYSVDQTWSGDVIIDGVIQFNAGTTLTIEPGTTVRFVKTDTDGDGIGENEIYVQGRLVANGTKERPIVFTSAEEHPRPGDWGAVNIMVSEGAVNELSNCVIEYGYRGFHMHFSKGRVTDCTMRNNYLGIQCQDSELEITGCTISHNRGAIVFKDSKLKIRNNVISDNYWAIRFLYGEVELTGNTITGNLINGVTFRENKVKASGNYLSDNRKGFSSEGAEVVLDGNIVDSNVESGIYLKHSKGTVKANDISGNGDAGISIEDSSVVVTGNDITGNRNYAVDNNGSMGLDARGNWWGTTDKAGISAMIYDGADEAGIGMVDFEPAAAAPFVVKEKVKR
jgi:parallel beta-helix repeat protein